MIQSRAKSIIASLVTNPSVWVIVLAAILWFSAPSFVRFVNWINP